MMHSLQEVLYKEKKKIEEKMESAKDLADVEKKLSYEQYLEELKHDINRLEQTKNRSGLQTFSEIFYIDDIRLRVNQIERDNKSESHCAWSSQEKTAFMGGSHGKYLSEIRRTY